MALPYSLRTALLSTAAIFARQNTTSFPVFRAAASQSDLLATLASSPSALQPLYAAALALCSPLASLYTLYLLRFALPPALRTLSPPIETTPAQYTVLYDCYAAHARAARLEPVFCYNALRDDRAFVIVPLALPAHVYTFRQYAQAFLPYDSLIPPAARDSLTALSDEYAALKAELADPDLPPDTTASEEADSSDSSNTSDDTSGDYLARLARAQAHTDALRNRLSEDTTSVRKPVPIQPEWQDYD